MFFAPNGFVHGGNDDRHGKGAERETKSKAGISCINTAYRPRDDMEPPTSQSLKVLSRKHLLTILHYLSILSHPP
jgi:hypothetical protein